MTTTYFGWTVPADGEYVKDGAAAIRSIAQAIDTALRYTLGGTTGQVLTKTSATDMAFTWAALTDTGAIPKSLIDAKGDLVVGTAADTAGRLAVGTNGQVLQADSDEASGMKWATPATPSPTFVGCIAYGAVNLAYSVTPTAVTLTSEIVDTDGFHSTSSNTSRMTIPTGKDGKYLLTYDSNLASVAGLQNIYLRLYKNGSAYTVGLTNGYLQTIVQGLPQDAHFNASIIVDAVAEDYFEMFMQSGSGTPTIDKARFGIQWLGA